MDSTEDETQRKAIDALKTVLKDYSYNDDEKLAAVKKLGTIRDREVLDVLFACITDMSNTLRSHDSVFGEKAPIQQAAVAELTQILQADASYFNDAELIKIAEMKTRLWFHFEGWDGMPDKDYYIDTSLLPEIASQELRRRRKS